MTKVFPFTTCCDRDNGGGNYVYLDVFLAVKPAKESWYGFDVVHLSRGEVEFIAYGMFDNCHGGIGEERFRVRALVMEKLTAKAVEARIMQLAHERRAAEIEAYEQGRINEHAKNIRTEFETEQC